MLEGIQKNDSEKPTSERRSIDILIELRWVILMGQVSWRNSVASEMLTSKCQTLLEIRV